MVELIFMLPEQYQLFLHISYFIQRPNYQMKIELSCCYNEGDESDDGYSSDDEQKPTIKIEV